MTPDLTIIVATYNRPEVLKRALRTLVVQTHQNWTALVIGDCCDDATGEAVNSLADARIRYINLPERFGEQAGPNSVGMALAETDYVAFLNHDDYWLPDHLEHGIAALRQTGADIFWARAALFRQRGLFQDRTFFEAYSESGRTLAGSYHTKNVYSEPLSAWIMTQSATQRIGRMRLASEVGVQPLKDLAMRASQLGLTLHADDHVSVLKDQVIMRPPMYANLALYAEPLVQMIEAGQIDDLREKISDDIWASEQLGDVADIHDDLGWGDRMPMADIHAETGINIADLQHRSRARAAAVLQTLQARTGEKLANQPDLGEMVSYARAALK